MSDRSSRDPRSTVTTAAARHLRAVRYLVGNLLAGLVALVLLVVSVAVLVLSVVGVGLLFVGLLDRQVRRWCDRERTRVGQLLGRRIDSPYVGEAGARLADARDHAASGSLGRDAGTLVARALVGVPLGLVAIFLPLFSLPYVLLPLYWWALPDGETAVMFEVTSWPVALAAVLIGLGGLTLWAAAPVASRVDTTVAAALLSPGPAQEQRRRAEVERLRRRSAVSAHSAELRRIERDLHDAAQNRLVAVAMYVGMAQRQLETGSGDPGPSLAKAGRAATDAIAEVRRVIHGIYPPVLAEEGLVPAVGLLVDQCQIPTRLHVDRPAPTPASVDAALYFAISELLTNIAKHSGARSATVLLRWDVTEQVRWVTAVVGDDGKGGADPSLGSGIAGVESRVRALGGSLQVTSPPGGPTRIEVSLPCES
ncbi:sensor domain-containing protein [Natronosporangium hydrolyticum]|uniref:histidine kinase n=1 Tax=Natronosporangium hydrolyticum TaxID=2811111 RepID=A0A895YFL0_9ACTN|nr:sensor domain-containing protein [Natronosporangium hydrolyticum]QSB14203.1 sensor domain-containing protein [Natronosporangium hydrolyticum]